MGGSVPCTVPGMFNEVFGGDRVTTTRQLAKELADEIEVLLTEHYSKWLKYISPDDKREYVKDLGELMVGCMTAQKKTILRGIDESR